MPDGKTRHQSNAYCETEAPEKLREFLSKEEGSNVQHIFEGWLLLKMTVGECKQLKRLRQKRS